MGTYSFKSVGKTVEQRLVEKLELSKQPIGIKTPLALDHGDGSEIFVTYTKLSDTVKDNLRNLILTNWGERLCMYKFGANIKPLMSELATGDEFDAAAIERINDAVSKWMPYVSLESYVSSSDRIDNKNLARINLLITYSVPALGVTNEQLEVNLSAM